jgi:hypothetical protein
MAAPEGAINTPLTTSVIATIATIEILYIFFIFFLLSNYY